MAFLRSFYVADDIWRFAWSLVGCLLALSWLPPHTHPTQHPPASPVAPTAYPITPGPSVRGPALAQCEWRAERDQLRGGCG